MNDLFLSLESFFLKNGMIHIIVFQINILIKNLQMFAKPSEVSADFFGKR
jgi:hypothetical protein